MKSFQMKKIAAISIVAAAMFSATSGAQAQTATAGFTVDINVTPACSISIAAPALTITYPDNSPADVSAATTVDATCTNGAGFVLSMDAAAVAPAGNYGPIADPDTALNYTLSFNVDGVTGGDSASQNGAGAVPVSTPLTANVALGQSATCANATCTSITPQNHLVYINY